MTSAEEASDREKVVTKLPADLRQALKVRCAQLDQDIKDAVAEGLTAWLATEPGEPIDTSGGTPFATYLPVGLYGQLKQRCTDIGVAYNQGVAQSIRLWLKAHPVPTQPKAGRARRLIIANQKGGVGKTAVSAGLAQALAEMGFRVGLIDYDPQGHLTRQLGEEPLSIDAPSLAKYMLGEVAGSSSVKDLFIPIDPEAFGPRLWLLPACQDAFLFDVRLATSRVIRVKETALERVLQPLEDDFDYFVVDCPPSLGYTTDTALYYGRTRDGEAEETSGVFIPVLADDPSADAFKMLYAQVLDLKEVGALIHLFGIVVNMYDVGDGYVATSSLASWEAIGDPPVTAVIPALKDQREAVRMKRGLLSYAPTGKQAAAMRAIARSVAK